MNSKKWLIVGASVVAAFAAFAAFVAYQQSMSHLWDAIFPARSAHTTNMRPVDITLTDPITKGQLHLRIPKAYLTKEENWKGGEQEIIDMQSRLPDMQPVPANPPIVGQPGTEAYKKALLAFNNGTFIDLRREVGDYMGAHERVRKRLTNVNLPSESYRKYKRVDDFFELEQYQIYRCGRFEASTRGVIAEPNGETCVDTFVREFISKDVQKPMVHITCDVNPSVQKQIGYRLGCHAGTGYHSRSLHYLIRYSEINRWQEFDAAVRRLLDGFVVGAASAKH